MRQLDFPANRVIYVPERSWAGAGPAHVTISGELTGGDPVARGAVARDAAPDAHPVTAGRKPPAGGLPLAPDSESPGPPPIRPRVASSRSARMTRAVARARRSPVSRSEAATLWKTRASGRARDLSAAALLVAGILVAASGMAGGSVMPVDRHTVLHDAPLAAAVALLGPDATGLRGVVSRAGAGGPHASDAGARAIDPVRAPRRRLDRDDRRRAPRRALPARPVRARGRARRGAPAGAGAFAGRPRGDRGDRAARKATRRNVR